MELEFNYEPTNIIASGDWHSNFEPMINKINISYSLTDSLIIQCGDFGVGFAEKQMYVDFFRKLNKKLKLKNNILFVLRGNHDSPEYFNDKIIFSNIKLVSDYSIISTPNKD